MKAQVYCDGSYRYQQDPKFGTMCIGIYLTIEEEENKQEFYFSRFMGYGNSSNAAEELAIQHSCDVLDKMNIGKATIFSDSLSCVDKLTSSIPYDLQHTSRTNPELRKAHYLAKHETKKIYGDKWKSYSIPVSF